MEKQQRKPVLELLHGDHYRPKELAELLELDIYVIQRAIYDEQLKASVIRHDVVGIARDEVLRWLDESGELD